MAKAADLKPGQSVFDHDNPERARYVHSVKKKRDGTVEVAFGHPDQEPEQGVGGAVAADKEFDVVAEPDGTRP